MACEYIVYQEYTTLLMESAYLKYSLLCQKYTMTKAMILTTKVGFFCLVFNGTSAPNRLLLPWDGNTKKFDED